MINNNVGFGFVGIDAVNRKSILGSLPFVAEEDGWIFFATWAGSQASYYLDGGYIICNASQGSTIFPIKKGQTITRLKGGTSNQIMVFFPLKY